MVPGLFLSILIKFKTKNSQGPQGLIDIFSLVSFVMSIVWINFTSNCIMDLLRLFGFVTKLPRALFGLTILAWGNCLGDLSANITMTKKGFGEMAITGALAGPIFNILIGLGASFTLTLLDKQDPHSNSIKYSVFNDNGEFLKVATLPLCLLVSQFLILVVLMCSVIRNDYKLTFKDCVKTTIVYVIVIFILIIYCLKNTVNPK